VSDQKADLLRGTLSMLILKTVTLDPMHGFGIMQRIEQITGGTFQVRAGSLFPTLHRLEQEGWLEGRWGESENKRRAKYYRITPEGRRQLAVEKQNWARAVRAVTQVLEAV
jgi:PadR family transcriptional regulator PadR